MDEKSRKRMDPSKDEIVSEGGDEGEKGVGVMSDFESSKSVVDSGSRSCKGPGARRRARDSISATGFPAHHR